MIKNGQITSENIFHCTLDVEKSFTPFNLFSKSIFNAVHCSGEVPQDSKDFANSEGSAELDERSGEESEEEGGNRSRYQHVVVRRRGPTGEGTSMLW